MKRKQWSNHWWFGMGILIMLSILAASTVQARAHVPAHDEEPGSLLPSDQQSGMSSATDSETSTQFYYYASGRRVPIDLSTDFVMIHRFEDGALPQDSRAGSGKDRSSLGDLSGLNLTRLALRPGLEKQEALNLIENLSITSEFESYLPVFKYRGEELVSVDPVFMV